MTTVIVMGQNRGGTSIIAGILQHLGVRMGPKDAPPEWINRHWSNPIGHFENVEFLLLNAEILDPAGRWRLRVNPLWLKEWDVPPALIEKIRETVHRNEGPLWGWKDNTTVFTLEHFLPFVSDPRLIFVYRDPHGVASSLQHRDGVSLELGLQISELFNRRMDDLRSKLRGIPALYVSYESTLRDPAHVVKEIGDFLGISPTPAEIRDALGLILDKATLRKKSRRLAQEELLHAPTILWSTLKQLPQRDPRLRLFRDPSYGDAASESRPPPGLSRVAHLALNGSREAVATIRAAL